MVGTESKELNLICQAKTGSGKTVAFVIGLLSHINTKVEKTQGIIICHTRELSIQVYEELRKFGKYMIEDGLKIFLSIPFEKDAKVSKLINEQVIVGTPGKIKELVRNKKINGEALKVIVLDEADHAMLKMSNDVKYIKENLMRESKQKILCFLFSATFEPNTKKWAKDFVNRPYYTVFLTDINFDITHFKIDCSEQGVKTIEILKKIFRSVTSTKSIIFFNRIDDISNIASALEKEEFQTFIVHSKLENKERDENMSKFRKAQKGILLSSDLLSRGIDIDNVNLVVNYDLPCLTLNDKRQGDHVTYIHRSGKTGRYGYHGITINLIQSGQDFEFINQIQRGVDEKINEKLRRRITKKNFEFRNYLKIQDLSMENMASQLEEYEKKMEEENLKHKEEMELEHGFKKDDDEKSEQNDNEEKNEQKIDNQNN